jgi:hypothetical protein
MAMDDLDADDAFGGPANLLDSDAIAAPRPGTSLRTAEYVTSCAAR